MPETAHQHVRARKKRKLADRNGCDPSSASPHHVPSDKLRSHGIQLHKSGLACNGHLVIAMKQPHVPPTDRLPPKCPVNNSLREHMESMINELKEAREKLFHWMKEELQALSGTRLVKPDSQANADKSVPLINGGSKHSEVNRDGCLSIDAPTLQDFEDRKLGYRLTPSTLEGSQSLDAHKGTLSLETKGKPLPLEGGSKDESGVITKHENGLNQNLHSHVLDIRSGADLPKEVSLNSNDKSKAPADGKSALFDVSFGIGLGDDVKDVEGLGGSLESAVSIREDIDFNKSSVDIQKGLDQLDELHETKSALFDMGFGNEESTEGNGVGCSLDSAASSKDNSRFSNGAHGGLSRGFGTGFTGRHEEQQGKEDVGRDRASSRPHWQGSSKETNEAISIITRDTHRHSAVNKGLAMKVKGAKSDEESRQVDSVSHNSSWQAGSVGQSSQPWDAQKQTSIGIKRTYGSAMTFKGSALESKNDILACPGTSSFVDVFNSATSSIFVMKNNVGLPVADKAKVELVSLHKELSPSVFTTVAMPAWNMSTDMKNTSSTSLHDSKVAHLEYASRSKLGDAILGSTRTADISALDPIFHYASQFKSSTEVVGSYPHERSNANSMYFSSLCTNTSGFLPSSNRATSMQYAPLSPSCPSNSSMQSMLMGVPGHPQVMRQDTSNLHTFLGLNVNSLPMAASGMQMFPGLYLQGSQQHNQTSLKRTASSTSPMQSHQESSEKAILELNF